MKGSQVSLDGSFERLEALIPLQMGICEMPFYRGPLDGQTLAVVAFENYDRPEVPPVLWHFDVDGSQHAYHLVEPDDLDGPHDVSPIYVHVRAFPPPAADALSN